MKKILLVLILMVATTGMAQTKKVNKLRIQETPAAVATDTLLAFQANGLVVNTGIAVGDVGSGGSQEGYTESGTRAANIVVQLGDYDSSNNGNNIVIDDTGSFSTEGVQINSSGKLVLAAGDDVVFTAGGSGQFSFDGSILSSSVTFKVPSSDGTLALTSDVVVYETTVSVSAAELAALNTTDKVLIPAQGPLIVTEIESITGFLDYGTTTYDFAAALEVEYASDSDEINIVASNWVNATSDKFFAVDKTGASGKERYADDDVILRATANPSTGNGVLVLVITWTRKTFN